MFNLTPWRKGNGKELARASEHPLERMRDEFDAMSDRFLGRWPALPDAGGQWFWDLDMTDTEKEYVIRAEAPGFEADDFDIRVSGNLLTIEAERKHEAEEKKGECQYTEKHFGRFQRSLTLPVGADTDKIEARYHSGVLELHVPKSEAAQAKRIAIKK